MDSGCWNLNDVNEEESYGVKNKILVWLNNTRFTKVFMQVTSTCVICL